MKTNTIVFWTSTVMVALMEGVMPLGTWLFAPEYLTFGTKALHYPDYFAYALVIAKILGVIAILYPKTPSKIKEWAYAGLGFTLVFAFISHACVDGNIGYMILPFVFFALLATSYIFSQKIKK